jgi:hypothetical protein
MVIHFPFFLLTCRLWSFIKGSGNMGWIILLYLLIKNVESFAFEQQIVLLALKLLAFHRFKLGLVFLVNTLGKESKLETEPRQFLPE